MFRLSLIFLLVSLLSGAPANACSCYCTYTHKVSDYLEDHDVFWGLPTQSRLTSNGSVITDVDVLEDYDRLPNEKTLQITSSPEDGTSCGRQLRVGVPQLIVSWRNKDRRSVGTCSCEPPKVHLFNYLKSGTDVYLPSLDRCWDDDAPDNIKPNKRCDVWRSTVNRQTIEHVEEMRIWGLYWERRGSGSE